MAKTNFGGGAESSLFSSLFSSSQAAANAAQERENAGKIQKWDYDFQGGRLTGHSYANNLRAIAAQYKDSDPQRYYQLLEQAQTLDKKNPGLYRTGGSGGSGGGGSGGSSPRVQANDATKATYSGNRDNYKAAIAYYKFFEDAYDKGQRTVLDPQTGKTVSLNDDLMRQIDASYNQALTGLQKTYDTGYKVIAKDGTVTTKADHTQAVKIGVQRSEFTGTLYSRNGKAMDAALSDHLNSLIDLTASASQSTDPVAASRAVQQAGKSFQSWVESNFLTSKGSVATANKGQDVLAGTHATVGQRSALEGGVDPNSEIGKQAIALSNFLALTGDPNTTPDQLKQAHDALVSSYGGSLPSAINTMINGNGKGNLGYGQTANLADGLSAKVDANGNIRPPAIYQYVDQSGHVQYVPVVNSTGPVPNGDGTYRQGNVPRPQVDLPKGTSLDVIYVPDANGNPVATNIIVTPTDAGLKVWQATGAINQNGVNLNKGDTLTEADINQLKADGVWTQLSGSSALRQASAGNFYKATAPDGTVYYRDGKNGAWFKGALPINYKMNDDGTIDPSSVSWPPNADVGGTPFISIADPDKTQEVVNSGQLDPRAQNAIANEQGRDENGQPTPQATYPPNAAFAHPITDPGARDSWYNDPEPAWTAIESHADATNVYRQTAENPQTSLQNTHEHGYDMSGTSLPQSYANNQTQVAGQDIALGGTFAALSRALGVSGPTGAREGVPIAPPKKPAAPLPPLPGLTSLSNDGQDVALPGARQAGVRVNPAPVAPAPTLPQLPTDLGNATVTNNDQDVVVGKPPKVQQPPPVSSTGGAQKVTGGRMVV